MLAPAAWFLVTALSISGEPDAALLRRIHVDCGSAHALDRALARARLLPQVDIVLHGVCEGNFVIASNGVTLRAASVGSGLAAPAGNPAHLPVLEVVDVRAILNGVIVRGGTLGVYAHGWNAEVFLGDVDVFDQSDAGVIAYRGASAVLFDSTVRDGATGVIAATSATINLQRVTVRNRSVGVVVVDTSSAALTDSTIEHCREAGMNVSIRSDVNILGGAFRETPRSTPTPTTGARSACSSPSRSAPRATPYSSRSPAMPRSRRARHDDPGAVAAIVGARSGSAARCCTATCPPRVLGPS
jgi:hypothetical protein